MSTETLPTRTPDETKENVSRGFILALIGAEIDNLFAWVAFAGGLEQSGKLVYVHRLVLQEDVLLPVDGYHHAFFRQLVDRACLRNGDFNAGLKHRRGEHEDEQEDEDDVDQRGDVDLGECSLGAGVAAGA